MVDKTSLEKVRECIDNGHRFVLTTHVNPDGDGLGAEAALAAFLADRGKDVYIFNSSPVPNNYTFLDPDCRIELYNREQHRDILRKSDYIFILDISDWERLRQVGMDIRETEIFKICIDHHPGQGSFVDLNLIDDGACSTGEIVYDLLNVCQAHLTTEICRALYTSLMTDTGSFRFSNTTARTFAISADLVKHGARPDKVHQEVNERESLTKVKLFGHILRTLKVEQNGRVAVMTVTKEILDRIGAKSHDTEGFADYPRRIDGVEISIMFIEREKGKVKMSLRSKGNYVINGIAQKFGGGGHRFAAGALLDGELEVYVPQVLEEIAFLLSK